MEEERSKQIILFDGVCNLCSSLVQFIIKRDSKGKFLFASLQSSYGQSILEKHDINTNQFDTLIVVDKNRLYMKSSAALKICRQLNGFWTFLYAFIIIPKPIRDFFYTIIARNRYKWFGKKEQCMIPSPEMKRRFIE